MKTQIIPQIKEIKQHETQFQLKNFYLSDDILEKLSIANDILSVNEKGEPRYQIVHSDSEIEPEAYRIIARAEKIEILTSTKRGLMYALFTLSELALINEDMLVEFDIYDEPALKFRASSDDISRGQISTTQDFFEIIKRLARYKYNTYMPYIEDVFQFESIPDWGCYSDAMGKEEWKAIIEFAKDYQIEVRPILNLLGHFDKLCYIEGLQHLALKNEDGSACHVMDPKKPEVKTIIRKILDEIVDTFGKGLIHAGGDEPLDLTKIYGKDEGGALFISHYTFVAKELKKRGCSLMVYADFFAPPWGDYAVPIDRARELPADTEFVFWDYAVRPEYPFVDALHKQQLKLYISPGSWTWKRFSCDMKTCYNNTKGLLSADNGRSRGMIMSSWADGGDTLREMIWPGVLIGGNFCWAPKSTYTYDEIYSIIHKSFYGLEIEQALLLDPIYHHDSLIARKHEHEFKEQMYLSPFEPVSLEDKEHIHVVQKALEQAKVDLQTLSPKRNHDAFAALQLTVARASFTANKIASMPHAKIKTAEEGFAFAKSAQKLAQELLGVKELHKKLWFQNNRYSDWDICELRYDELYNQLQLFARNAKTRKLFMMFH